MKNLLIALKVDQERYDSIIFQQWFNWCGKVSKTQKELQLTLANTALFNWWRMEYSAFERDFLFEISPYKGQTSERDAYLLYIKNVHKIQLYYSKPLITNAIKNNING